MNPAQTIAAATSQPAAGEELLALRAECARLQALVGDLLVKNQELRFALALLKENPAPDFENATAA